MPAFIETQFPIARLSAESYKERKANNGQTLTRLGKWWGRKPLILVRASILGMLMPASDDPKKDRGTFLKILTMDDGGALHRWRPDKRFSTPELEAVATPDERERWNELAGRLAEAREKVQGLRDISTVIWRRNAAAKQRDNAAMDEAIHDVDGHAKALGDYLDELQVAAFQRLSYADRIRRCERPENVAGPSEAAWLEINAHLGTAASSLPELVESLGQRTFGHTPRVGDSFLWWWFHPIRGCSYRL